MMRQKLMATMVVDVTFLHPLLNWLGRRCQKSQASQNLFTRPEFSCTSANHCWYILALHPRQNNRHCLLARAEQASENHLCSRLKSIQSSQVPLPEQSRHKSTFQYSPPLAWVSFTGSFLHWGYEEPWSCESTLT